MQRVFFFTALIAAVCTTFAQNKQSPRFVASPAFPTAQQLAGYLNAQVYSERVNPQFICEYSSVSPTPVSYRVVCDTQTTEPADGFAWNVEECPDLASAVAFANKRRVIAQFISCWNPQRRPDATAITVFYTPQKRSDTPEGSYDGYHIFPRMFPDAESAAATASALDHIHRSSAQFVSQLSIANQLESVWHVVYAMGGGNRKRGTAWYANESSWYGDEIGALPLQLDSALRAADTLPATQEHRFVATSSTEVPTLGSRMVLFTLRDKP